MQDNLRRDENTGSSHDGQQGPFVVFKLIDELYAVPALNVRTMIELPDVVTVPQTPDHIRGMINLRGNPVTLMDLRCRLDKKTREDEIREFTEMLDKREEDHKNWLAELEASVREKRKFKGATDPHKCAFGKWYDNFETNDHLTSQILRKFDRPHKVIHGIAARVIELEANEAFDEAVSLIELTRANELAEMIKLFASLKAQISSTFNEIVCVMENGSKLSALTVDSIESVEYFNSSTIEYLPDHLRAMNGDVVKSTARRQKDDSLVMMLDAHKLIDSVPELKSETANA